MKKLLTIVAIFMTMLCGSIFLVSCSSDYKKMYLVVEYALPTEEGKDVEWKEVDKDSNFDYVLSQGVYSEQDMSHVLYLRVKVKGTKKKVNSLYISQSANNSTFLESNTVKPNEAFKVLVKNIGSVRFTVTPSQGGEDKVVSFGVNVYKELTSIAQNTECVPAVVTGGYIRLENLTNLIKYEPANETNQTGVDFSIEAVGSLVNDGTEGLLGRAFIANTNYSTKGDNLIEHISSSANYISLDNSKGYLMLNVSTAYNLTTSNNVIKLKATSRYHQDITTDVYVYIVENFKANSLLVSYSPDVKLDNGNIPTDITETQPIGESIVIYNSTIGGDDEYNAINMYTYTNASIYSYETNPGMQLNVFVNGVKYDYTDVVNNNFGIQISPLYKTETGVSRLVGLKFEVNPNSISNTNVYNVRLELDFNAFDFSASDKAPVSVLNKEFTITVENLASGFHINGKGYSDNLEDLEEGVETRITGYDSTQIAKLYTSYSASAIGMPLNIQATPTNAINTMVSVGFYESYNVTNGNLLLGNNLADKLQVFQSLGSSLPTSSGGVFEIDFNNKNKIIYLRFNELADISDLKQIYMVCKVVCTPESFGLNYITFVATIDVVGSVDKIYVYKLSTDNVLYDTLTDTYLANATTNTAYINFSSHSNAVDLSEIKISSAKSNIKYSSDGINWGYTITADMLTNVSGGVYKLYFRTEQECADSLVISSPNGISKQRGYQFVNVTSSSTKVNIQYDNTYIESLGVDNVDIDGVTTGGSVQLQYLALQSGRTAQFKAFGDNKNNTIKSVEAKSLLVSSSEYTKILKDDESLYATAIVTFSSSAIRVSNTGEYLFDIKANSVGFTAILLVKVDFYVVIDNKVEPQSKYFVYEVAVYTPARELVVNSDKTSIIYINENYPDTANVEFNIELNNATRAIYFSSSVINNAINLSYGADGTSSIYGISVQASENVYKQDTNNKPYFKLNGLAEFTITNNSMTITENFVNNSVRKFSVQALQSLLPLQQEGINSISFDVVIYQFGKKIQTTEITKVIYLGDYNKAESIIVVSGVEKYNNIYLSLLGGEVCQTVEAYATNEAENVTYKDLGYYINQFNKATNSWESYTGNNLKVVQDDENNTFEITASDVGGLYQLVLYAKDSYNSDEQKYEFEFKIQITVSDGKTEETAYLIKDLNDFVTLASDTENKFYRLYQNIDISALNSTEWWKEARTFAGTLDGAMTITEPNSGTTIYKCYSLIGLEVKSYNVLTDSNCFGLFSSVTGTIKNVVFENAVLNINLSNESSVNIGIITAINNGIIENCSINMRNSLIKFATSAQNTNYNIGLVAGLNNGTILYQNTIKSSNYSHMVDFKASSSAGKLTIVLEQGNINFGSNTNLNIGGVVGQNSNGGLIAANYLDESSSSVRELIAVVVNIELQAGYNASNAPMDINEINLGGVAGHNIGKVEQIAISGSIVANDKSNIGGIVGKNQGIIKDVATYGAYIKGYSWNDVENTSVASKHLGTLKYYGAGANQEQNIGGIVGFNNAGTVDNVRTMFILFTKDEVSVAANSALLTGIGNVGGIIGKAINTQLTRAYVENFVTDDVNELDYNIIGSKANVAGLIADVDSLTTATLSFVQADFDVLDCDFYEFGNGLSYEYVYFIGDVLSNKLSGNKLVEHNEIIENSSYIINNIIYVNNGSIAKNVVTYGVDKVSNPVDKVNGFEIRWLQSDEEGVNDNQPYLVYIVGGKIYYTLTVRPTDIIVNVDQDYFDKIENNLVKPFERFDNGIYLQYVDNNATPEEDDDDHIVATAIVYYVEGGNNTHKLISDDSEKGLIEKTILPTIADGSYSVSIISGSNIATLTDADKSITFEGVGYVELKFVSIFDRTKTDTVVIFVENPLHSEVFDIAASAGLEDRNQDGARFTTRVGVNSLLTLSLKDVNGQKFDSSKTYMTADINIDDLITNTGKITVDDLSKYFTLTYVTDEIENGKYAIGQFNVSAISLDTRYSYLEIPITLNVYLNLANYYIKDVSLSDLMDETPTLLASKPITIIVYNKATAMTVSSDVKAEAGESVDIVTQLTTGYINEGKADGYIGTTVTGSLGNKLLLDVEGQDKIEVILTAVNYNAQDLLQRAKENSANPSTFSIWDLFDVIVNSKLNINSGYTYSINLKLKDIYRYLDVGGYDDREWKFNLNIVASSNTELSKNVEVSFAPQVLIGLRIENYSNLVARNSRDQTVAEFVSSQTESSLIIPSESGLVKIFADYSYSYFEDITISSSRQNINGKEYFIRYQQMIYNKNKDVYESYAGITADGESLTLKKVSYIEGSEYKYDGVLFVRTILDEIVGVRKTFTITVNANTYDLDGNVINISRDKTVISQYRPGVYISVTDALTAQYNDNQVYLVEKGSSITTIVARVYGYEFNIQPNITIAEINEGDTIDVAVVQQGAVVQDNTGAYVIKYSVAVNTNNPFKITMKMELIDDGNTLTGKTEELLFYPVPYIINDVYLKGEANGGLSVAINTSKNIDLVWSTKRTTSNKINEINTAIMDDIGDDYLKLFSMYQINSSGQDEIKYFSDYLNATDTSFSIKQNENGTYCIESLIKVAPITVYFNLWYGYDLSNGSVKFSLKKSTQCPNLIAHEFKLNLIMHTTEDAPNPISSAEDLLAMAEGENYILMEDITLENWTPLNTAIASLDGNGKLINIKSFNIAVSSSVNAGLFATVSENTILKNVVVNISTLENNLGTSKTAIYIKDDNITNATVNFGLLAGVNNGLIYNCEILSINSTRTVEVVVGSSYTLTFGGLVGINQGNITNSRVGSEYFENISYTSSSAYSAIVRCGQLYFKAEGIVAGFVGVNEAYSIISSSFVANTSVENSSNSSSNEINRTAGFVATNEGTIAYSYVKGLERNILTTKSTTASTSGGNECIIYASGAGSVAGFAYYNSGEIHDCYSNTVCKSNSAAVAGFVYNTVNGSVYQCYSASRVESGNTNAALATELPFVGVGIDKADAQQLLSSDEMLNCYYLEDGTDYDENYKVPTGAMTPKGLSLESFANSSNLNNFSFISDSSSEQQLNGVWTYSTGVDSNRSTYPLSSTALPELTSANNIARSIRMYTDTSVNSQIKSYKYATSYEQGSKNNPYIIRSVDEYQSVFIGNSSTNIQNKKYITGYVRFIDDISFVVDDEYINIETRSNYILGDENNNTFTLIDGNGMTISDVVINYSEDEKGNLGLFSEVYHSVIKGLNIEYASQTSGDSDGVGSSTATFVGGVAGIAKNTYFIDIDLTGSVTLRAHNVVGGVVGCLTGANSGLYNISTNLNVQAGNYSSSNIYAGEDTESAYLSYAGGIAGIIDIGKASNGGFNVNRLTVSSSVRANRAGGIAGYLGKNSNAKRLTYIITNTSQVFGHEIAGGIVADNYANIELSQANSVNVDVQYEYDRQFAQYINAQENLAIDNDDDSYGNLNAVVSDRIAGGFIGVNYGGCISNSLTKANIGYNNDYGDGMPEIAGGFIGKTYGGSLEYVYAQNYIDLTYTTPNPGTTTLYYGGVVGYVAYDKYDVTTSNASKNFGMNNVVAANWFDRALLDELNTANQHVEYVIAKLDNEVKVCLKLDATSADAIVNYGVFNADENDETIYEGGKISNQNLDVAKNYSMEALYYVSSGENTTGQSTQQETFDRLFAVWPPEYWDKLYTRFMPNLKLDNATDYIIIDDPKDVILMEQLQDRNFILVKDVTISPENVNYVVNANFRGVLIGTKHETEDRYTRFNVTLKDANTANDMGAGFFKQTTGARIANIGFNYEALTLNGSGTYQMVGGVSATDQYSRFEQITVSQSNSSKASITTKGASVAAIGSIVGEGRRSNIVSCNSNITFDLNVNGAIGGLVGSLDGYYYDEDEEIVRYDGLISSSMYSGKMTVQSLTGVTIGGIVANAEYSRISDSKVVNFSTNKGEEVTESVEIAINSINTNNIGGIVGIYNMCSVANCSTDIKVVDRLFATSSTTTPVSTTYYIGGIVAQITNSNIIDRDIDDCYSYLTYGLVKATDVYLGGIVANQASSVKNGVTLNRVVSDIKILANNDTTGNSGVDIVKHMTVGGIVGLASGEPDASEEVVYGTNINDSIAIMECDVAYNSALYGGGLIGQSKGSYSINNSTAMGYIWANNANETHMVANSTPSLTVLGGLVGLADKVDAYSFKGNTINQQIKNSYSALTLSVAGVYQGENNALTHNVYTNSIVGYTHTSNQILGSGILYSSDYTLALEVENWVDIDNDGQKDVGESYTSGKFANEPKNVTANVLMLNTNTLRPIDTTDTSNIHAINGYIGEGWMWEDGHLPMPRGVQNLLIKMGILEYVEGSSEWRYNPELEGKAYYPIAIGNQEIFNTVRFNKEDYTYYSLQTDVTLASNKGDLNGVILGNNRVISGSVSLFNIIDKHSAVTNLTFVLNNNSTFNTGAVATTNNGTIFMCGVQYENINANNNFGGLVQKNNGVISNCYNMGNAQVNGTVAGLAFQNTENATIEESYFTGSFNGGSEGAALVYENKGYIANSYSAGMASTIIENLLTDYARYVNIYYDYYANYIKKELYEEWANLGIKGLETFNADDKYDSMQKVINTSDSALFDGWKVYSIHNWDEVKDSDEGITGTYNYGYPIHNIQQLTYDQSVKPIPIRSKRTGDGTFVKIVNRDGEAITADTTEGVQYIQGATKGKLVYDDSENSYYDNFSFLINNLGVLDLINTINTEGKYFELEVNMELPTNPTDLQESDSKLLSNWRGLGNGTNPFTGTFTTTSEDYEYNNVLTTNVYNLDRTLLDEPQEDTETGIVFYVDSLISVNTNPKTITNLTGGALFAYVENGAVITGVALENSCVNSAPLIGNVGKDDLLDTSGLAAPTVYKVNIKNSITTNIAGGNIAGLIDMVKANNTLHIHSVEQDVTIEALNEETGIKASVASGLINKNDGTINIKNSFKDIQVTINNANEVAGFGRENSETGKINIVDKISITLNVESDELAYVSGLISLNLGEVKTLDSSELSMVTLSSISPASEYIAGLIGSMQGGVVGGVDVVFASAEADSYKTKLFGGVVANFQSGDLGIKEDEEEMPISVKLTTATANIFGGIAGIVNNEDTTKSDGNIKNITIEVSEDRVSVNGNNGSGNAYGLIIGQYLSALNEIYYTLASETTFKVVSGNNVGGIVGYAKNGEFNFTNEETPPITKVYGMSNVGGFIGQYEGGDKLKLSGQTWSVGGSDGSGEYAQIEFAYPEKLSSTIGVASAIAENFGGIIGFWNSSSNLECYKAGENGESLTIPIVNNNKVLNFADSKGSVEFSWFTNTEKQQGYDYVLANIGGVVGRSTAGIINAKNNAIVGVEIQTSGTENENGGNNPIYGTEVNRIESDATINEIMQYMYVGGIAGIVTSVSDEELPILTNCVNSASVYGMYAVGGLVGGSDKPIAFNEIKPEGESSLTETTPSDVVGLVDVGGVIGRATNVTFTGINSGAQINTIAGIESIVKFKQVVGIVNVGGIVGNSTGTVTITSYKVGDNTSDQGKVVGNMNVGGLIGFAKAAKVDTISISNTTIYGSVFDYKYEIEDEYKAFYYLPTNIGGVVGFIEGEASFNLLTTKADVKTDENFVIATDDQTIYEVTVNMTSNNVGVVRAADNYYTASRKFATYLENHYSTQLVRYDAVDGGIGGFAGRLNSTTVEGVVSPNCVDCVIDGDVYASYGINVGGIVGYLNADPQTVKLPSVSSSNSEGMNVAGRIFVGGYIGRTRGFGSSSGADFFSENTNLIINVNVQQYKDKDGNKKILTGFCIGGIIGYVAGDVYNIKLTDSLMGADSQSKIKVFNSVLDFVDSTYVGTLVGRLDGNMSGCEIDRRLCDAESDGAKYFIMAYTATNYAPHGIIRNPNVYNYGGLVGLANVKQGSIGDNKTIIHGEHYYPFTVDTVENRDYQQGVTEYNYIETENMLTAIAHYVNLSDVSISVSALTGLYNIVDDYNPTNPDARGWAKEYTLFHNWARNISQPNEPTGDSVQIIYTADYVTEVVSTYKTVDSGLVINNEIVYTIYQPIGYAAKLYCKYGIATLNEDFSIENLDIDAGLNQEYPYELNYEVRINSFNLVEPEDPRDRGSLWFGGYLSKKGAGDNNWHQTDLLFDKDDWPQRRATWTERDYFWHHIKSPTELGLEPDDEGKYWTDDGNGNTTISTDLEDECNIVSRVCHYTFGYTYYVCSNYMGEGEKYFVFETVFGQPNIIQEDIDDLKGRKLEGLAITARNENFDLYSNSGSIFEVTGTCTPIEIEGLEDPEAGLKIALEIIKFVGSIVLEAATLGASPLLELYLWGKAGKVAGFVYKVVKFLNKTAIFIAMAAATAISIISNVIGMVCNIVNLSHIYIEASYDQITDISSGYLSSDYANNIVWEDGQMQASSDGYIPLGLEADITLEGGGKLTESDLNAVLNSSKYSNFEKFLIKQVVNINNNTYTVSLDYCACSTSRAIPGDINDTITVSVESMPGVTDVNSSQYNLEKSLLTDLGIQSYTVPKYKSYNGEMYTYGNSIMSGKRLKLNYEEVVQTFKLNNINSQAVINRYGYGYIINNGKYDDYIVPEDSQIFINEQYEVNRIINETIECKITNSSIDSIEQVNLKELSWAIDNSYTGGLALDVQFKYAGTNIPSSPYISYDAKYDDHGKVYYSTDGGDDYYSVQDNTLAPTGVSYYPATAYFTLEGTGNASVNVTLKPSEYGNISYNDLPIKPSGTWYYNYIQDDDGDNVKVSASFEFGLSNIFDSNIITSDDNNTYTEKLIGEYDTLKNYNITLYKFNPNAKSYNDPTAKVEDYFTEVTGYTYENIYNAIYYQTGDIFEYSITNQYYNPVKDNYKVANGNLYSLRVGAQYLSEKDDMGNVYIYSPIYETEGLQDRFVNKYVYNATINGHNVKLYTRFKYDYSAQSFLDVNIGNAENPKLISDLLLPTSTVGYKNTGIIFSESCRVTLSASGRPICYGYKDGRLETVNSGKIEADYSIIN